MGRECFNAGKTAAGSARRSAFQLADWFAYLASLGRSFLREQALSLSVALCRFLRGLHRGFAGFSEQGARRAANTDGV
jgi:hypothetical protein